MDSTRGTEALPESGSTEPTRGERKRRTNPPAEIDETAEIAMT
jgi:hypothetical protein